jgi:hypothetical protein
MDTLNQKAIEDRRQHCKSSAEDAEISDHLLGEMLCIGLFVTLLRCCVARCSFKKM